MAVNKNFVVKNGLEVDTNTLFVDSANNRVAIGTTVPTASLDVRGKILSDSQVESWVGKFVGIVTAGAVGVTTLTYSVGTGSSTKLGRANAEELNVTAGFTTVQSMSATDIIVSVGSTFSKDVNIGAAATVGAALTVTGGAKIALDSRFEKALEVGEDLNVGAAATITGISTFTGAAKFAEFVRFEKDIAVGSAATVGVLTVTNNTYIGGNLNVGGDINLDELVSRNLEVTGIATIGFLTATNSFTSGVGTVGFLTATDFFVSGVTTVTHLNSTNSTLSGITTISNLNVDNMELSGIGTVTQLKATTATITGIVTTNSGVEVGAGITLSPEGNIFSTGITTTSTKLNVGLGGTMMTVVAAGSSVTAGINSTSPQYVLDVHGDINSSSAVNVAGVSVLVTASNDATALAIALG